MFRMTLFVVVVVVGLGGTNPRRDGSLRRCVFD